MPQASENPAADRDWFDTMVEANPVLREARDYGIDLRMLWDNLQRSPEERIRRHQIALELFDSIYNAANK